MYAYFKNLDYFSTGACVLWFGGRRCEQRAGSRRDPTNPPPSASIAHAECTYSPFAARGLPREFIKDLEVCVCGKWGMWGPTNRAGVALLAGIKAAVRGRALGMLHARMPWAQALACARAWPEPGHRACTHGLRNCPLLPDRPLGPGPSWTSSRPRSSLGPQTRTAGPPHNLAPARAAAIFPVRSAPARAFFLLQLGGREEGVPHGARGPSRFSGGVGGWGCWHPQPACCCHNPWFLGELAIAPHTRARTSRPPRRPCARRACCWKA